jgi:hypothetical protein
MLEIASFRPRSKSPRQPAHPERTPEPATAPDARGSLLRLVPLPLAATGDVLGALGIKRTDAQEVLNAGLRAGTLTLAHSDRAVLVVAAEGA